MPDVSGPFDAQSFAQAQYYRDRGPLELFGVVGPPGGSAATGGLALTTNGLTSTLALGRAHVRGAAYERTGTAWTYTHPANSSTAGPRLDRVVLRRDLTAKSVVPAVLQGTPAASPTAPALTQDEDGVWELPLHLVSVPANSGTVLTVTDERTWIGNAAGAQMQTWARRTTQAGPVNAAAGWVTVSGLSASFAVGTTQRIRAIFSGQGLSNAVGTMQARVRNTVTGVSKGYTCPITVANWGSGITIVMTEGPLPPGAYTIVVELAAGTVDGYLSVDPADLTIETLSY